MVVTLILMRTASDLLEHLDGADGRNGRVDEVQVHALDAQSLVRRLQGRQHGGRLSYPPRQRHILAGDDGLPVTAAAAGPRAEALAEIALRPPPATHQTSAVDLRRVEEVDAVLQRRVIRILQRARAHRRVVSLKAPRAFVALANTPAGISVHI